MCINGLVHWVQMQRFCWIAVAGGYFVKQLGLCTPVDLFPNYTCFPVFLGFPMASISKVYFAQLYSRIHCTHHLEDYFQEKLNNPVGWSRAATSTYWVVRRSVVSSTTTSTSSKRRSKSDVYTTYSFCDRTYIVLWGTSHLGIPRCHPRNLALRGRE